MNSELFGIGTMTYRVVIQNFYDGITPPRATEIQEIPVLSRNFDCDGNVVSINNGWPTANLHVTRESAMGEMARINREWVVLARKAFSDKISDIREDADKEVRKYQAGLLNIQEQDFLPLED